MPTQSTLTLLIHLSCFFVNEDFSVKHRLVDINDLLQQFLILLSSHLLADDLACVQIVL